MNIREEYSNAIKEWFMNNADLARLYGFNKGESFDGCFSSLCIESILINTVASAMAVHEAAWGDFKEEINNALAIRQTTSVPWYYDKAKGFQIGYELEFNENTYSFGYSKADETARIVKNVAIREVIDEGVSKLKVYYSDADKQPLSSDQKKAFESYMRKIGAAGTHYLFVSQAPDTIQIKAAIYYDAMVLDSSGKRLDGDDRPVEKAITEYFNGLEYGGTYYASRLVDAIQRADGVADVVLEGVTHNGSQVTTRKIEAVSGAFAPVFEQGNLTYYTD